MQNAGIISGNESELGEKWESLHHSSDAPVFSSLKWLKILAEVLDRRIVLSIAVADGEPVAGIPLLTTHRGPLTVSPPLPISLYSGMNRSGPEIDIDDLVAAIERQCNFCVLQLPPDCPTESFITRGWSCVQQRSRVLDTGDFEMLWSGFSQSLRRKVRRAEERGYRLTNDVTVAQMLSLYSRSYQRHGIQPPIEIPVLQKWLDLVSTLPFAQIYGARTDDGALAAFRLVLRDRNVAYDWLAGSDDVEKYPGATHWVLTEVLRGLSSGGVRMFDFMGANAIGVSDFKELFGGEETTYHTVSWYRPSFLRSAEALRNRMVLRKRGIR